MGVHTPEYLFEKSTAHVQAALKRFDICYRVAQDNSDATWSAFNNQYWPAADLIDADGCIVYQHFGERRHAEAEAAIRKLFPLWLMTHQPPPCRLRGLYG